MFSFFKKNSDKHNLEDRTPSFEVELTAAVLAYEIARIDGEVTTDELKVLMEEIKLPPAERAAKTAIGAGSSGKGTVGTYLKADALFSEKKGKNHCIKLKSSPTDLLII